ncbi:MAG: C39 family peptidase, partial [bacterium]|nr:C39 family peptidase [bacterium]
RLTSSPWPESIEVSDSAEAEGAWRVKGYVLLRTSADLASGGAAVRLPIELTLEKEGDRWLIAQVVFNQSVLFEVPFSPQAPFANWLDSRQNYGCEETSALMAVKWARGEELTPEEAEEIIVEAAEWQIKHYGEFHDTSAKDTVDRLLKGYFGYQNAQLQSGIAVHHIKQALWDGNIVIVPVRGRELQNPYYTPPGPLIHMVVVAGYDGTSGEFIVNDPGTRRGAKIRYEENLFVAAIRDYASGHNEPLQDSEKVMIVVSPEAGG